ncbi:MAG: hypothetical protein HPM95_21805, partial [Alphaproteobacteria bacterium]|nr:hypothetical protein [Alphaproteobacteria bacterium]
MLPQWDRRDRITHRTRRPQRRRVRRIALRSQDAHVRLLSSAAQPRHGLFPPLTLATLGTAILAGLLADGAWEIWARFITPLWVGGPLQPAALVQSVFGFSNFALAEAVHLVVGIVFYPLGYLFIARPIADRFFPFLPWPVVALGFGAGLWVF